MFKKQFSFRPHSLLTPADEKKTRNFLVRSLTLIAMLISLFGSPTFVTPARAARIVVNTDQEIEADNSLCSLYEAVFAANTDTAYKGCPAGSGADVITFADDYTITLFITELQIVSPITITGRGITNTVIQASDCNPITTPGGCMPAYNRVISVYPYNVTINDLTIQHGNCIGLCADVNNIGGGIYNAGGNLTLNNVLLNANKAEYGGGLYTGLGATTLNNVTITGNDAGNGDGKGGGVYISYANTTFTDVAITDNTAKFGGGVYSYLYPYTMLRTSVINNSASSAGGGLYHDGGTPYITNSTISDNNADFMLGGGGIYNNGSNPTLTNVTISGNSAENSYGGGMFNTDSSYPILTNVTFSDNLANTNSGGGMYNIHDSHPRLYNTLIANSAGGGDCVNAISATIEGSSNYNLIEDNANACGLTNGVNGDIVGQDPLLGALQNNGGNMLTHALQAGSPAIDAGTNTGCPTDDQRGIIRPQGVRCDIGSFELEQYSRTFRSVGAQDGWVLESSETSNKGGTFNSAATAFRLGDDAARKQYRAILSFNTSGLPDNAVITKVTLKVKRQSVTGGGNPVNAFQGFMADVKKGMFGTSALQAADFQTAANKTVGPLKPPLVGGWYSLNLTGAGNFVNKLATAGGITQVRLRFKLDDNNNAIANYLSLFSGNAPFASRPQLIVEYYIP